MTTEPETWLGNIEKACCCEVGFDPVPSPRTACLGCGLPLPHAGECKRGDR